MATARAVLVLAAGVYAAYFSGLISGFAGSASVFPQVCIAALMALSLWLPFSSGQLSLAQAGFMALGAYASAWLTVQKGWPFGWSVGVSAAFTAACGLVVSYPALRLRGIYLAVATLGLGEVIRIFFINLDAMGGAFGFSGIPGYTKLWHLTMALALLSMLTFGLMRGRIGRAVAASRHDAIAAACFGVQVTRIRVLTFSLGAFIAGLAGALEAHYVRFITPENYDLSALIGWLTMVMLGGFETFLGPLAGSVVVGTLSEMLHGLADWRVTINAVILIALLIFRPQGIVTRSITGWRQSPRGPVHPATSPAFAPPPVPCAPSGEIIRIESMTKRFGGVLALDAVEVTVMRGDIHAVIGPNGAGKTTLFNIITGLETADAGRVLFGDRDITKLSPQEIVSGGVARTFQSLRLFHELSALENVMLGSHVRTSSGPLACAFGFDRAEEYDTASSAMRLLELVELSARANEPAGHLAYADQRRLEIARALASRPAVLLLDEPAAGMSTAESTMLAQLIRHVRETRNVTVVLIDHDMEFLMGLCERITVMNFGRVIAHGDPASIQQDEAVLAAYLGTAAPTTLTAR